MIVVGDVHGKAFEFSKLIERLDTDEPIFQVGDMGMGFGFVPHFPKNVKWIRGNHDDPQLSRMHSNYLGDYGYLPEHKMFYMAGAWSIDWAWRKASNNAGHPLCWWPDEELSQPELDAALALYIETEPEVVISHEAPSSIVPHVLAKAPLIIKPGDPMYSENFYRPEKLECIGTRTSTTLQRMLNYHQPKQWVFGHYHIDKNLHLGPTQFHCVGELSHIKLPY